jgi:carbonic anhydrase/acetyltransferase-like protein (isoleucine patch superfamily)
LGIIDSDAVVLRGAVLCGDVTLSRGCSVWYNAVLRADEAPITVGEGSNIQDCAVLHVEENFPVRIGAGVTIGHGAIVHGCTVGDGSLIGMGATVMSGVSIGKSCIIGAGALVTGGMKIPDGCMAFGVPAKLVRKLTEAEIADNRGAAEWYLKEREKYR